MGMQLNKILYSIGILLLLCCKGTAQDNVLPTPNAQNVKSVNNQIDFFNKKYFTGYNLAIDESNISDHPYFSYLDCKNEGYFSVHFIPKETDLQTFWKENYYKGTDFNTYDFEKDDKKIEPLLKNNVSAYNIFSYFIKKEYLNTNDGCTLESVWLNKDATAEIYLYNVKNNNWELVKKESSEVLPPYVDDKFFISNFSNLFPKKAKIIEEEKLFPSNLEGEWAVNCENGLTTFRIEKEDGIVSLYGNSIYIKVKVEKLSNNEYYLKFKNITTQKEWVDQSLKITESNISKDKIIGKFFVTDDGDIKLQWIGLYNMEKQRIDYADDTFSLIRENGGKNPILLQKCL